jgi:hypothetical protein
MLSNNVPYKWLLILLVIVNRTSGKNLIAFFFLYEVYQVEYHQYCIRVPRLFSLNCGDFYEHPHLIMNLGLYIRSKVFSRYLMMQYCEILEHIHF